MSHEMYSHTICSISLNNDNLYEIISVIGFPSYSDQIYFLDITEKKFGNFLAVRHGFKNFEELVGFQFNSKHKSFDTAMEFLLFGRFIDSTDPDWLLRNILVQALIEHRPVDMRGIDPQMSIDYINHEIKLGNIVASEDSYECDGSKWIQKVNNIIKIMDDTLHPCSKLMDGNIRDNYFYFTISNGIIITTYLFTVNRDIITKVNSQNCQQIKKKKHIGLKEKGLLSSLISSR